MKNNDDLEWISEYNYLRKKRKEFIKKEMSRGNKSNINLEWNDRPLDVDNIIEFSHAMMSDPYILGEIRRAAEIGEYVEDEDSLIGCFREWYILKNHSRLPKEMSRVWPIVQLKRVASGEFASVHDKGFVNLLRKTYFNEFGKPVGYL